VEERPPIWVGHVVLRARDIAQSAEFWAALGMRVVEQGSQVAILEMRGGTHLILVPGDPEPGDTPFDLMVEDLDATHADWSARNLSPSVIEEGSIHRAFSVRDPDGYVVTVNSSHVVGPV
jgi:catechol 2,3-dioxygenase-like lactoylglutathione lyase family enzyme